MSGISVGALLGALALLILMSAFFSAAEIGLMTVNRYRLRHLAESGHRGARFARRLLERPDRLLGLILLGNNSANIAASFVASVLTLKTYGSKGLALAAGLLTIVVLIFAEVAPKTLAALYPERISYPAAYVLLPLLGLLYPFVWLINAVANLTLRVFGVSVGRRPHAEVTAEELRALVREADVLIPVSHQDMLLAILDLERIVVDDVMVPRNRIEGIDLDADWDGLVARLTASHYTRLPVFRGSLENIVGILHVRQVLNLMREGKLDRESLQQAIAPPYFIPSGTPLNTQLLNFRQARRRIGLVVDEYGDLQGLVSLDEILEEIVGDFTSHALGRIQDVHAQPDGSYLIKGAVSLRDINRQLGWNLSTERSRTLNGLILEFLEDIPQSGTSLMIDGYQVEILRARGTAIDLVRIHRVEPRADPPATP